jgi:hypothetical protein
MKQQTAEYLTSRLNEARRGVKRPKVLGYSKKHRTCDHCGKTGLERTVEIELPDGSISHFGSECADRVKALKYEPTRDKSDPIEPDEDVSEEEDEGEVEDEGEDDIEGGDDGEEVDEEEDLGIEFDDEAFQKPIDKNLYYADPLPHVEGKVDIDNFDKKYQICNIIFDSKNGVGSTGNNDNIRYMGFGVMMKPKVFLDLCFDLYRDGGPREKTLEHLKDSMLVPGWGPSMLYVDIDSGQVVGHEGRHRALVFKEKCPDMEMLVHIKPSGTNRELRSRNITKDMLNKMNRGLFTEQFKSLTPEQQASEYWKKHHYVKGKLFSTVFLDQKTETFK